MKNYYNKEKKCEYYLKNKELIKQKNDLKREELNNYAKDHYEQNREKMIEKSQKWRDENKDKQKQYRENNKEKIKKYNMNNKLKHNQYKNEWVKSKCKTDVLFKLKVNLRSLITQSIKRHGLSKKSKTPTILGCSYEEFKQYIESNLNHG